LLVNDHLRGELGQSRSSQLRIPSSLGALSHDRAATLAEDGRFLLPVPRRNGSCSSSGSLGDVFVPVFVALAR
jgi:hypothetical protein